VHASAESWTAVSVPAQLRAMQLFEFALCHAAMQRHMQRALSWHCMELSDTNSDTNSNRIANTNDDCSNLHIAFSDSLFDTNLPSTVSITPFVPLLVLALALALAPFFFAIRIRLCVEFKQPISGLWRCCCVPAIAKLYEWYVGVCVCVFLVDSLQVSSLQARLS
jgi:hypothetical protein